MNISPVVIAYTLYLFCIPRLHIKLDTSPMLQPPLVSLTLRRRRHYHPLIGKVHRNRSPIIQINNKERVPRMSIVVEICEISFRAYVNAAAVEYEADVRLRGENCRLGGNESS